MDQAYYKKNKSLFIYLLYLTGFFLLLEISFFIQCNKAYLSDFSFVSNQIHLPWTIVPGIAFFICAELMVHVLYAFMSGLIALGIAGLFSLTENKRDYLGMILWAVGLLGCLAANQYYFPNSKFAELTQYIFISPFIMQFLLASIALLFLCCSLLASLYFGIKMVRRFIHLRGSYFLSSIIILLFFLFIIYLFFFRSLLSKTITSAATYSRPNIILIGIDSVRPDFLGYAGRDVETPFFDTYLSQAAVFDEAVTPLARTFPSWTSVLTGLYPKQNGVRFNLSSQQGEHLENSLPAILKNHGYETAYATDETRFSNIDERYGFDQIVTPPMGLNDFLLGSFNDFPLSNLLINTRLGAWLFPYSYGNRPAYFSYEPDSFLHLLEPLLQQARTKPLFLAVHFCLPHHPYLWRAVDGSQLNVLQQYEAGIMRTDQQVRDFFALLSQYQLLNHAIVVLLSDHGEALALSGDRITEEDLFVARQQGEKKIPHFYPESEQEDAVNQSVGHGTDVLGLPQYHTVLAFKFFGLPENYYQGHISGVVSLLDIKPTILTLIGLDQPIHHHPSGLSLAESIKTGHPVYMPHRHLFLESDYSPAAIRTVYPETRKVLLEGIQLFQVDPLTTRLFVRKEMGQMIINSKQYADIYGSWMLALYPQGQASQVPILINLVSGKWTDNLQSAFARRAPAEAMLAALRSFYGEEIKNITPASLFLSGSKPKSGWHPSHHEHSSC